MSAQILKGAKPKMPDPSVWGSQIDRWDDIALAAHKSPTAIGICSGLLYLGALIKKGESVTVGKALGGMLVCIIVGMFVYEAIPTVPDGLRALIALAVGSACDAGLAVITERALDAVRGRILKGKDDSL